MYNPNSLNWRAGFIAYALLFLWIGVIFFLSSNNGSMTETSSIIEPILRFLFPNSPAETIQFYHGYMRKGAHLTEYAILAFLAFRAFSISSGRVLLTLRYILPLVLVAAIACLDEFNQSFEASRTSSGWDVLLDIAGGSAMIFVLWLIKRTRSNARMYRPFRRS
ncbi:MAG: VanZ family protein [Acidobacteriota bacterium]